MTDRNVSTFKHNDTVESLMQKACDTLGMDKTEFLCTLVLEHSDEYIEADTEYAKELKEKQKKLKEVRRKEKLDNLDIEYAQRLKKEGEIVTRLKTYAWEMRLNGATVEECADYLESQLGIAERAGRRDDLEEVIRKFREGETHKLDENGPKTMRKVSRYNND